MTPLRRPPLTWQRLLLSFACVLALLPVAACGAAGGGAPSAADAGGTAEDPPSGDGGDPASTARTVGLLRHESGSFQGYTLFAPMGSGDTYLIDNDGSAVHSWSSAYPPGLSAYLLEDGSLLRTAATTRGPDAVFGTGGAGGRVERISWHGTVAWTYDYADADHQLHHDIEVLPNGNVLMIAWERKTAAEAVAAGRDPSRLSDGELWPDHVIEVQPDGADGGQVVWAWHAWDHLVQDQYPTRANYGDVAAHPELIDLNFATEKGADWNHVNSIDYDATLDQILLSVHSFGEIWVIDHSTTTAEAAGHTGGRSDRGGDLLYRWGNPQTYGAGDAADQRLFAQHDARWIEADRPGAGRILVFNNGQQRGHSSVDELDPPVQGDGSYARSAGAAYGPVDLTWSYTAPVPADFLANHISGAHRLPNGNTLICDGPLGTFFEVTAAGEMVWEYVNPVTTNGILSFDEAIPTGSGGQQNSVFRAERYGPDHPGFAGRDLTGGSPIEAP